MLGRTDSFCMRSIFFASDLSPFFLACDWPIVFQTINISLRRAHEGSVCNSRTVDFKIFPVKNLFTSSRPRARDDFGIADEAADGAFSLSKVSVCGVDTASRTACGAGGNRCILLLIGYTKKKAKDAYPSSLLLLGPPLSKGTC